MWFGAILTKRFRSEDTMIHPLTGVSGKGLCLDCHLVAEAETTSDFKTPFATPNPKTNKIEQNENIFTSKTIGCESCIIYH